MSIESSFQQVRLMYKYICFFKKATRNYIKMLIVMMPEMQSYRLFQFSLSFSELSVICLQ